MNRNQIMGTIVTSVFVLFLVSALAPAAFAYSASPNAPLAKIGAHAWKAATDNAGNTYTFTHTKHTHPRAFTGELTSSSYLVTLPWSISGTQKGNTFSFTATNPTGGADGDCEYFTVTATFTSSTSASGTWVDSPECASSGTITFTAGAASPIISTTGGLPGKA